MVIQINLIGAEHVENVFTSRELPVPIPDHHPLFSGENHSWPFLHNLDSVKINIYCFKLAQRAMNMLISRLMTIS